MNVNIFGTGISLGLKRLTDEETKSIDDIINDGSLLPNEFISDMDIKTYPCTSDFNVHNLDVKERVSSTPEIVRPLFPEIIMGDSGYYILMQGESFYSNLINNKEASVEDTLSCKSLEYDFNFFSADIVKEISVNGEHVDLGVPAVSFDGIDIYVVKVDDNSTNLLYRNGVWYC